jgi:hypothetical protein
MSSTTTPIMSNNEHTNADPTGRLPATTKGRLWNDFLTIVGFIPTFVAFVGDSLFKEGYANVLVFLAGLSISFLVARLTTSNNSMTFFQFFNWMAISVRAGFAYGML